MGRNDVYLLGHAWSTFKPLHDASVSGRLVTGMQVIYADGGRVHTHAVVWWTVVAPMSATSWAWASLSRPSMTLQTCVGSNSQSRLMVWLVRPTDEPGRTPARRLSRRWLDPPHTV